MREVMGELDVMEINVKILKCWFKTSEIDTFAPINNDLN